jgi:hypothetical protein
MSSACHERNAEERCCSCGWWGHPGGAAHHERGQWSRGGRLRAMQMGRLQTDIL